MKVLAIFFMLFFIPIHAVEVRTSLPEKKSDSHHYHLYAKQFAETIKSHAPIDECHVILHDIEKKLEIRIEFEKDVLTKFLSETHNIRFVSQSDRDRYISNLRTTLKNSASEIFTEIEKESILIQVQIK